MKTLVILPGGFHPYHAGHYELYKSAVKAFPGADVYVAATNDQKARPFPFAIKEKLAKIAGVAPGRFIQVKSPFKAQEIADHYDPDQDVMIFVRSEKDRNEQPKPGGMKKDGTPSYFQPYTGKGMQPFSKHAYFAYLPTVKFGPGITSATEIRNAWPTLNPTRKTAMVMSLYPATKQNPKLAANVVKMMDLGMGAAGEKLTEDSEQDYLWHGSTQKIPVLNTRQAVDTGGDTRNNQNAIYATDYKPMAIMLGLATKGSDIATFVDPGKPLQLILFSGKIRHGENVYLHKLPRRDEEGKEIFLKGGSTHEFYSRPDIKEIRPLEIISVPVDKYLNLVRKPTADDLKRREYYLNRAKQGVAEDKESDPVTSAVLSFYKPVVNDIHKEKLPDYVDQARHLLHKTNDPKVRGKLIDIFKKGKENPYIQGGIVTTVGALLAGGVLSTANSMGLSPAQTNLALQAILNTVIPTVVSRINGKNWTDTIKYTLASAGVGTGIAGASLVEEDIGMGGNAITEEQSRTGNPLYWSELDDGLSVDDKMSIIEGYYTTGTLKESNSEDSTQYFTALHKFSSALVKNEKYVIAPLILVNDKIMALDKPDYMQFVGYVDDRPVFNQNGKEKIYPSNRCKELTVYQIFAFPTKKMYDKFRTALSLKFDMVLPEIDNQDMTEAYPNQQKSLYKPDSTTYRGEKMPTLTDPNDIYNNRLAVNIDDQDDEPADEPNIDNSIKALIKSKLDELTPIERKVLQLRYWHDMTLADIADRIEVSAVRIRQIEAHAFRKIKKSTLDNRDADLLRQYVPESESKPIVPFSQVKQFPLTALLTGQGAGTALKADPEYRRDVRRNKHAAAAKADVDNRVKAGYSPDTDEGDWDSNE